MDENVASLLNMQCTYNFVCITSGAETSDLATSFNQSMSYVAVQRSSILQQALDISEGAEPKLMLPRGAAQGFLKDWLQFTQLSDLEDALGTSSTACIVSSLQVLFLATGSTCVHVVGVCSDW